MSDAFNWGVLGPRLYPLAQSKFCGQYWGTVLEAGTDELDNAWVRVQFTNITTVLYLNHNSTYLNLAKALLERRLACLKDNTTEIGCSHYEMGLRRMMAANGTSGTLVRKRARVYCDSGWGMVVNASRLDNTVRILRDDGTMVTRPGNIPGLDDDDLTTIYLNGTGDSPIVLVRPTRTTVMALWRSWQSLSSSLLAWLDFFVIVCTIIVAKSLLPILALQSMLVSYFWYNGQLRVFLYGVRYRVLIKALKAVGVTAGGLKWVGTPRGTAGRKLGVGRGSYFAQASAWTTSKMSPVSPQAN